MKRNNSLKRFAAAVCAVLLCTSSALSVLAEEVAVETAETPAVAANETISKKTAKKSYEPTAEDMEAIIKRVRPLLTIPQEYTDFDWNYNAPSYYRTASWRFTWTDKDGNGRVRVTTDEKGNIVSFSNDRFDRNRSIALPRYTREALAKTAEAALAKLCPHTEGSMRLTASSASSLYSQSYYYTFTRYENDILVPDDTASVMVNYVSGEVTSLSASFHDALDFSAAQTVNADAAKKALTEAQTMKLSYRLKNVYDDEGKLSERKAYLVYSPERSYLSVDAQTGKVYTERNTWSIDTTGGAGGSNSSSKFEAMADDAAPEEGEYELTEEELAGLETLKSLISRDAAIQAVLQNKALYIEPEATAVEARLVQNRNKYAVTKDENAKETSYIWSLSFRAPYRETKEDNGYYYAYMTASVDASTGKLISFHTSVPDYRYYVNDKKKETPPELVYSSDQADELFRAFAQKEIPSYMENVRLSESIQATPIKYEESDTEGVEPRPIYRVESLNYTRVNEGVDFSYNGVYGAVDRVTGKVTSFSYSWYDDVTFESPTLAVAPEKAYEALLSSDGFGLNYEINSDYTYNQYLVDGEDGYVDLDALYDTKTYTRLVWSGYAYDTQLVSALTGKLINYAGEEYKPRNTGEYTDIAGHWAEKEIQMLCDLDFRFPGDTFAPDRHVTEKEFIELLEFFGKSPEQTRPEKGGTEAEMTRTQAVRYVMDAAGYYKIAAMPDIFITDFADNSELKREDVGFIAIARGMGLVQGDASLFRPYDEMTRAEAVTLILNFLKASE